MAVVLTEMERHLLEMLAEAGRPMALGAEDLALGKVLEQRGLLLFVRDNAVAVIYAEGSSCAHCRGRMLSPPRRSHRWASSARPSELPLFNNL